MALIIADRIKETTTTTGTGALALGGAATGFRAFSAVCTSPSDTCYYTIDDGAGNWEVGLGTYSAANTLTRTTVLASSNAGAAVSFAAGTKNVWLDVPAAQVSALQNDFLSALLNAEVSVTGTATATIGKMHVCSGTSADYTVTLPAVSGNAGKCIGFRMDQALTKLVTLDGNSAETIDGAATRVMWAGEVAILYCDGITWTKIGGKSLPMYATMRLQSGTPSSAQSLAHATSVKVLLNQIDSQVMSMGDTTNKRINIKRAGTYAVSGLVYISSSVAFTRAIGALYKTGVQIFSGETSCASSATFPWCQPEGRPVLAAGDYLELYAYQQNGSSAAATLYGDGTGASNILSVMEIPSW